MKIVHLLTGVGELFDIELATIQTLSRNLQHASLELVLLRFYNLYVWLLITSSVLPRQLHFIANVFHLLLFVYIIRCV